VEDTVRPDKVPDDFPREPGLASLAGSHVKLAVRFTDSKYCTGFSDEELYERYGACEDLAQQLASYATRKASENPAWSHEFNLARTRKAVAKKVQQGVWDISEAELSWVMTRVQKILGW
jgi:hypothetical protein